VPPIRRGASGGPASGCLISWRFVWLCPDLDQGAKLYLGSMFPPKRAAVKPPNREPTMRLTTRTNLAMRTLMFCAANPGRIVRKHEVADVCNASENHLAQVIHLLAQRGYLRTVRGRAGGLMLARPPESITVGEVFRAFESVLPFTECFAGAENSCPLVSACRLKCVISDALALFYKALDEKTVADLVTGNEELTGLLRVA
jgi:Rrf2 family nitric oxide-sensitive transcriptional repressor